jgi:hypothetical protein
MLVSQNEIYRLTQRALEGSGAPHGTDRDGAFAVAWLEARGLPGLVLLAAALDRLEGAFAPLAPPRRDDDAAVLDLQGRPVIAWGGAVLDCFELLTAGPAGAPLLRVQSCRWPLFLLPFAARRAESGRGTRLRWGEGDAAVFVSANPPGDPAAGCRIVCAGDPDAVMMSDLPADVVLSGMMTAVRAPARPRSVQVVDAARLDDALNRSLAEGIAVDDAVWARIGAVASRVLVPASEESRARGAGGGDANQ